MSIEKQQIEECLELLKKVMGKDLLAVYLFGSSVSSQLQKYSDIDLFVVIHRPTTLDEKTQLGKSLLDISGIYMKSEKRPIEMTMVVKSAVNPWHYPPQFDFQYGDWLRGSFTNGNSEPWETKEMPDLALVITQVLLSSKILLGHPPEKLLASVPYSDFIKAMEHGLTSLMDSLETDTRNVLLTLARKWRTLETDTICSKPMAADWVIARLPKEYQVVMERAKAICIGKEKEHWDDLEALIRPTADFMFNKIKKNIALKMGSDMTNKSIKIEN